MHLISPILSARKFPSGNYSPFKITVAETSLWSLFYINQTSLSRVASEKYDRLRAAIKCFSVGVASSRMRINRLAERELRWWSASWWGFLSFFDGCEGSVWRAWRNLESLAVAGPAVSQTVKHNKRADVQSVWLRWSLQPSPVHLSRKCFSWNCLFLCVCGLNCRFTYISLSLLLFVLLLSLSLSSNLFPCHRSFQMVSWRKDSSQINTVP